MKNFLILGLVATFLPGAAQCANAPADVTDPVPAVSAPAESTGPKSRPVEPAPSPQQAREATPAAPALSPTLRHDLAVAPQQKDLSRNAEETYAYLLFIQAILDEDEAALLDAAQLLSRSEAPSSIWLDGGVWLMSRKSPNAVVYLEKALEARPDDLSLSLLHAEALGDHGMAGRGVARMRDYLARHPDSLDAKLELALLLVKDRQFDEAQKLLGQITQKQRTPLVDYYQAKALLGMDRRPEAIPYLRKAVRGMPDFVEALAELAFAYEQEGNLREARNMYEKLQKLNFSPQDVGLRLINLSLRLRQPEKAVQYIRQGPETLPFRLTAANMLLEARHYLQAEGILKQIVAGDNAPAEVYLLLADLVYEQRHNLAAALAWLDKAPTSGPAAVKAWLLRCQLMAEAGRIQEALTAAREGVEKFPDSAEIRDLEIRLLAREKKLDQALAQTRLAVEKWPDNPGLAFLYGSLLDETGKKQEALEVMEKLLKTDPDNFQAMNYIGFTLAEQGRDLARALELLQKADELSPDQAYIVDSLAWALYKSGKLQEALKQIRRAVNLDPGRDPAIWEHYGDIARSHGKKDEARRAFRKALELKPENAAVVRGKLSRI